MNKKRINNKLEKLYAKQIKSMDFDEIWDLTREILYFRISLGLLKKYKKQEISALPDEAKNDDDSLIFPIGNIYPNSVLITTEKYKNTQKLVSDFIRDLSPFLNEAERMLFKVAICEEHFTSKD
jgi:hypothetical protein